MSDAARLRRERLGLKCAMEFVRYCVERSDGLGNPAVLHVLDAPQPPEGRPDAREPVMKRLLSTHFSP